MKLVISTAPRPEALTLARTLVEERLAACVNVLPGASSVYEWEGEIRDDEEAVMLIKTTAARVGELCRRLEGLHSYEVPEIIVVDIRADEGNPAYHAWLRERVG
jgi:periplasmic divalent cation tolerance protein